MPKLNLYKFTDPSLSCDIINDRGNVSRYKEAQVVATDEESARIKAKLDSNYILISVYELGKEWVK